MPIDASIYQHVKAPAPIDPSAVLTGVLKTQALQQAAQDEADTRRILQTYGGDLSQTTQALRAKGLYAAADAIDTADTKRRQERANALKQQLENQTTVNSRLSGYINAAQDGLTPDNAPQRLTLLRQQILSTPPDPDDPPGAREQIAQQLTQFDPAKTPALLDQWKNGLLSEQEQVKQHQDTLRALYGEKPVAGAAQMLAQTTDPQDYADEYRTILGTVHDPEARALIAQSFPDPASLTTPEAFAAAKAKASALTTSAVEKATIANQGAERQQAAANAAETARHNRAAEGTAALEAQASLIRAQKPPASAGAPDDAKVVADAIIAGDQPPDLSRLYGKSVPVRAELARQHYNLTKATEDWTSTQKYLSTLNGAQQTRLRQAVEFTRESLPVVKALVQQWDSAGLPVLSKANLDAAASGAYGAQQQSLAVRLKGQIADLTSELGTVYKGGNSSTDESLKLAAQNLQGNWSKQAALDAIDQIERNLTIRQNSIANAGPVANAGNQYAPQSGGGSAQDPLGIR